MAETKQLLVLSDIHFAGPAEKERVDFELQQVHNPMSRMFIRFFRRVVWLRDPFGHNHLLDQLLERAGAPDIVIANGDYSCDSAFIGVMDDPSFQSASLCIGKLREKFGARLRLTIGDHEIGKQSLAGRSGGFRIGSLQRATHELGLQPTWSVKLEFHTLIGVTSSLLALPVFEPETLPNERDAWKESRNEHIRKVAALFEDIPPGHRILLFCHDPSALPFLAQIPQVSERFSQIERTVIGHLHTPLVFRLSRVLAGMPTLTFLGNAVRRMSSALNRARGWKPFKVVLCPSLAGSQLLKDGGFYRVLLHQNGRAELIFEPLRWENPA
ncbi:MAG: metallophosphoesterase [Verrucomicrobiota bacterium]|nr:metallophosphoesterase [Verrucomicrobiota bacterium]